MQKLFAAFVVLALCLFASLPQAVAQTTAQGDWTWVGGTNTILGFGVYGTLGVPAAGNIPGGRSGASQWTDKSGNVWLFGGSGSDGDANTGDLNDLWEFNPATNLWAWMGGSNTVNQPGVYGSLGTPAAGNIPGNRVNAVSWTDSSGNFWLFGGYSVDANGRNVERNDLWEFNPSTDLWAWIGGSNQANQPGVYGSLGIPSAGNIPGARALAVSWTDSSGNFWLFGGIGYDAIGNSNDLGDLWEFNPSTNQWTWVGGSQLNSSYQIGVYGTLLTPAAGNIPGSRSGGASWTDSSGNLWLFGGYGIGGAGFGYYGALNDLWLFNPSTKLWSWMGGSTGSYLAPNYGTSGIPAAGNTPGSRVGEATWTDNSNRVFLFAGNDDTNSYFYNDLWQLDLSTLEWTWIGGSNNVNQGGVYGTLGTPAATNLPGGRQSAANWSDSNGHLWLFGGYGYQIHRVYDYVGSLNDLWEYQPAPAPPAVATPKFSPASGKYSSPQSVTISDTTPNATIYYTTDGSFPTTSSAVYSSPIPVSASEIIKATATASGYTQSPVATAAYSFPADSTITLTSSPSPSVSGQLVAFTATLNSGATGTVTFNLKVNNVEISIPSPIVGNTAVLDTSELAVGSNTIVATYNGDSNWKPATSSPITQVVSKATAPIALTSSVNPSGGRELVVFTATLNVTAGIAPTGTVTFNVDNGAQSITAPVVGLSAALDTSYLAVGSHTVVATYNGDSNWNQVTSSPLTQVVNKDALVLTGSANPSAVGQLVVFTSILYGFDGPAKTGTVTFDIDNGAQSIKSPVQADTAALDTAYLTAGTHTIVATYSGDSNWPPTTSAPLTQNVNRSTPTLTLTSSPNPVLATQVLNVTVTFDITTGPAPTGTVTFASENAIFGQYTSPVNGLTSSTNQFQFLPGTHTIYATYSGDSNWKGAEAQLIQVVNPEP